jgi:hypothetical protein
MLLSSNRLSIVVCLICLHALVITAFTVKEESYSPQEAGKVRQHNSKQNEKFVKKEYIGKEVLVSDDEDDEDETSAVSSSDVSSSSSHKNPIVPNTPILAANNELKTSEFGLFGKHRLKKDRLQRVDQPHKSELSEDEYEQLKAFHRQSQLQARLQRMHADRFDFDYDEMLERQLKAGRTNSLESLLEQLDDDEDNVELNEKELEALFNERQAVVSNQNKPVKSDINRNNLGESLMEENDYNRQSVKKQSMIK